MRFFWSLLFFFCLGNLFGQQLSPVAENVHRLQKQIEAKNYSLFQVTSEPFFQSRHNQYISGQEYLNIDRELVNDIQISKPEFLELEF